MNDLMAGTLPKQSNSCSGFPRLGAFIFEQPGAQQALSLGDKSLSVLGPRPEVLGNQAGCPGAKKAYPMGSHSSPYEINLHCALLRLFAR